MRSFRSAYRLLLLTWLAVTQCLFILDCVNADEKPTPGGNDIGNNGDDVTLVLAEVRKSLHKLERVPTNGPHQDLFVEISKKLKELQRQEYTDEWIDNDTQKKCFNFDLDARRIIYSFLHCNRLQTRYEIAAELMTELNLDPKKLLPALTTLSEEDLNYWIVSWKVDPEFPELSAVKWRDPSRKELQLAWLEERLSFFIPEIENTAQTLEIGKTEYRSASNFSANVATARNVFSGTIFNIMAKKTQAAKVAFLGKKILIWTWEENAPKEFSILTVNSLDLN